MYTSTILKKVALLLTNRGIKILKGTGISHGHTPFLMQLWKKDGLRQKDLYMLVGVEQPTAVRILDRMEGDGLIFRKPSPNDRRASEVFLTSKGKECNKLVDQKAKELNQVFEACLTKDERAEFDRILFKIQDYLQR